MSAKLPEELTAAEVINDVFPDERSPLVMTELRLRLGGTTPAGVADANSKKRIRGLMDVWRMGWMGPTSLRGMVTHVFRFRRWKGVKGAGGGCSNIHTTVKQRGFPYLFRVHE